MKRDPVPLKYSCLAKLPTPPLYLWTPTIRNPQLGVRHQVKPCLQGYITGTAQQQQQAISSISVITAANWLLCPDLCCPLDGTCPSPNGSKSSPKPPSSIQQRKEPSDHCWLQKLGISTPREGQEGADNLPPGTSKPSPKILVFRAIKLLISGQPG